MGGVWGKFMPQGAYSAEQAIITLLRCYESAAVEDVYADWRSAPGYDTVEIALTFGGDCTFGRGKDFAYHNSFDQMYDQKGEAYFFSNLKDFHNDDLTMVNFEGTLTNSTAARDKQFVFKGRAEYAGILSRQHRCGHGGQQPFHGLWPAGVQRYDPESVAPCGHFRL